MIKKKKKIWLKKKEDMIDLDPNLYITYIKCKWIKHYN